MSYNINNVVKHDTMRYIKNTFVPYYNGVNQAHGLQHIYNVYIDGLKIITHFDLHISYVEMYLMAFSHDMFSGHNRKEHHSLAYDYLMNVYKNKHNVPNYDKIAIAVLEHRASGNGVKSNTHSDVLSSADLGAPNVSDKINRAIIHNGGDVRKAKSHIKDKYGTNGYVKYPKMYIDYYDKVFYKFINDVDNL